MKRATLISGAVLAGAIAISGCGGSSGLSMAQLDTKGNAICVNVKEQGKKLVIPSDFATNPVALSATVNELIAIFQPADLKLKALKPTSSIKSNYDEFLSDAAHEISMLRQAANKAKLSDLPGAIAAANHEDNYNKTVFAAAAKKVGLTKCV
jgi:hypothetical protein